MDSYVKAMAQMKDAFEIGYKDTYQLRTDFETKKRMTREQITDPKLIDKLNTYRRKTGEFGFQNFKFEPGTGNWFREKDLKEDDFRF